ncbi:DNA-directed RNA polymerase sigma-70 factor [Haloferula helveola]|uniref:DNA-directed RNA polymerase sigma-70 factor n=1 Tax=Haloferula helveola TaxID=490095 RepID=A0ABM7RGF0_9BACT|nr:DNA-directed RNA polymerase sigma-70 factor [Haloferula helveola]
MSQPTQNTRLGITSSRFPKTRWTLVASARGAGLDAESAEALEELCRAYWQPVYAYIRRRGNSPSDAEDLTQGFFAVLLRRKSLDGVDADKGRLRTFLLTAVSRHMASEHEKATAAKRGDGAAVLPLDCGLAEEGFVPDPGHNVSPDLEFDRQWAMRVVAQAYAATAEDEVSAGRGDLFEELKGTISACGGTDRFSAIAERLGMSEGAVKVAAHRLRGRYGNHLRELVASTLVDPSDVDEEIRHLLATFGACRA